MALYHRNGEKRRVYHDFRRQEEEVIGSLCRLSNRPISPKTQLEQEKRIRREIANSNERRRMQSINAGFQSLRTLLPHHDGEKLSKAAILQHTSEYIYQLEQEKTRLLTQNCQLKRLLSSQMNLDSDGSCSDSPLPKRKKIETAPESSDEGIGNMSPNTETEPSTDDLRREMIELRVQLDRERRLRMMLEEQTRNLEAQLYPERIREIAQQVQLQYQQRSTDSFHDVPQLTTEEPTGEQKEVTPAVDHVDTPEQDDGQLTSQSPHRQFDAPQDLSASKTPGREVHYPRTVSPDGLTSLSSGSVDRCESPEHPVGSLVSLQPQVTPQPVAYHASTSRQNLETIVEAIRHLEGDHLFRDDPEPQCLSRSPAGNDIGGTFTDHSSLSDGGEEARSLPVACIAGEYAVRHHVIHCSPITQSRPGVIVANHS